jgi:hypothetical protein
MNRLAAVALLLLLAAAMAPVQAATFRFTEQDLLESDEALWELYGRWAAHHEVEREPGRFATFKANAHAQATQQEQDGPQRLRRQVLRRVQAVRDRGRTSSP